MELLNKVLELVQDRVLLNRVSELVQDKELLNRTKYNLDVTTGQRKYGGPPPKSVSDKEQPAVGAEVFIGKIPRDMFEGKAFYFLQDF